MMNIRNLKKMELRNGGLRVIGLVLGMLCAIINGLDMSFNVYALPMKVAFNFTQTQVEILSSLGNFGMGLGFVEIIFFSTFGYKATFLFCGLMVPVSSGILSMAVFYNQFFKTMPVLLYIVHFAMTFGNVMSEMIIYRVLLSVCPENQTATLFAMLTAMQSFGKIVFAMQMDFFFFDNLSGFFLTLSLASFCLFGTCFSFHYRLKTTWESPEISNEVCLKDSQFEPETNSTNSVMHLDNGIDHSSPSLRAKLFTDIPEKVSTNYQTILEPEPVRGDGRSHKTSTTIEMLKSPFFHLVFWPSVVYYAGPYTVMNNITTVSQSAGFEFPLKSVYVITPVIIISRIAVGLILDKFPSVTMDYIVFISCDIFFSLALLLGMLWLDTTTVYIMAILDGIALASGYNVCVPMLMKHFGKHQLSFVCSSFFCVLSICITVYQVTLGYFYDSVVGPDQDMSCLGSRCFYRAFCFILIVIMLVFTVQGLHFASIKCTKRRSIH